MSAAITYERNDVGTRSSFIGTKRLLCLRLRWQATLRHLKVL